MIENILTDLTIDGDKPAKTANDHNARSKIINFKTVFLPEFPIGFIKKFINIKIKPTCNPETDSTCIAPAN